MKDKCPLSWGSRNRTDPICLVWFTLSHRIEITTVWNVAKLKTSFQGSILFSLPPVTNYTLYSTLLCKKTSTCAWGVKDISPLSWGGAKQNRSSFELVLNHFNFTPWVILCITMTKQRSCSQFANCLFLKLSCTVTFLGTAPTTNYTHIHTPTPVHSPSL